MFKKNNNLPIVSIIISTVSLIFVTNSYSADRWFSQDSPWNVQIKNNEQRAVFGEAPIAAVRAEGKSVVLNTRTWTASVVTADRNTPRYDIKWDRWAIRSVPVPNEVVSIVQYLISQNDTDRGLCIHDTQNKKFYAFFAPSIPNVGYSGYKGINVQAGGIFSENGSGWWDNSLGPWAGRSSGASYCAGLVNSNDLARGVIEHALSAGWPKYFVRQGKWSESSVYPAKTSDGQGRNFLLSLPMGTRLQLDPSLTVQKMKAMGLKNGDIVVAQAMQKYGVYIVDSSETFAIYFESDQGKSVYKDVTSPWPLAIMTYFHATSPVQPMATAPLESRLTQQELTFR